jgi:septal ring factor EnvC (AmiA/AmiB activator)
MKYLSSYRHFNEKIDIKDTDEPDVKMSKEKLNALEDNITEFNQKKSLVDTIFKNQSFDMKKVEEELKKLLGTEESGPGKDRNPFLVNYAEVSKLSRKVDDLQNSRANDKVKLDEFREELNLSTDENVKLSVNARITDIQNRLAEKSLKITELQKEIEVKKKELDTKISDQKSEIDEFIKKIKEQEQK